MSLPELVMVPHVRHPVPDGLDEVVMSCNLAGDDGELLPVVPDQDGEHGGHLVLQAGSELELKPRLRLKQGTHVFQKYVLTNTVKVNIQSKNSSVCIEKAQLHRLAEMSDTIVCLEDEK